MTPKNTDNIMAQILSCLDGAASRPGLVQASVHQTEGYLRGLQGLDWETPTCAAPSTPLPEDPAGHFIHDVRNGAVALRGRIKKESDDAVKSFLEGVGESFPKGDKKPFAKALARLWVRWSGYREELSHDVGKNIGALLKQEYDEGVAGELSAYILDDRVHLRNTRDYLRMRGWLQGTIQNLRRKADWESRQKADMLEANFSSIVLRALHNASVDYAADVVRKLPFMNAQLDLAIADLAAAEPEASHFLRKNKSTILTHALHSGYLDYPEEAAAELPRTLKELNRRIGELETSSPEAARSLRSDVPSLVYRALTNGRLSSL